jgi:hypothetical protein
MLVSPVHQALITPRSNFLHLPLEVRPWGVESQVLPMGGRIGVDFRSRAMTLTRPGGEERRFELAEHSQASLFRALLEELKADELAEVLRDLPEGSLVEGFVARLHAEGRAGASLTVEAVTGDRPLVVDPRTGSDYAEVLHGVFTGLARFRARLEGHWTPLILWPHHFDISTLWFHLSNPEMDDHGPHLNFGFSPFTPGQYPEPYLFVYAYPYPEPFDPPPLPAPAFWHDEGWRGVVVRYEDLRRQADPVGLVEEIALQIFRALAPLLDG